MGIFSHWHTPEFPRNGSKPADLVAANGNILTMDDSIPHAEAVAVKDKRFVYVGDENGVADFVGPGTEVINLKDRFVTPGFIDNHCHVMWIGGLTGAMTTELYKCKSLDDVGRIMKSHAETRPDNPIVMGVGWAYDYLPGALPEKRMLDAFIDDRPVVLMSLGGQSGWANSNAWEMMQKRNPEAFKKLSPSSTHHGLFLHFHSFNPLEFLSEDEKPVLYEAMQKGMKNTLNEALSTGVTTMNDVQIYRDFMPLLLKFKDRGGLDSARIRASLYVDRHDLSNEEKFLEEMKWWKSLAGNSDDHLRIGHGLKFYADGVISNHTAFMLEPYSDEPSNFGVPDWEAGDLKRVITMIDAMGLQAMTHACGDGGARRIIDAYEAAMRENGPRDARHRVDHCELPTPEDQARMAELGIQAAMQPTHYYGEETSLKAMGPERRKRHMPWGSLKRNGVDISFGSDWCAGPINPVYGLLVAGMRVDFKGNRDSESGEVVPVEDAIRYWTMGSARALHMEKDVGSVSVGKYADMAVFRYDLRKITSWWFLLTHKLDIGEMDDFVDMTFVDGKVVFRRE